MINNYITDTHPYSRHSFFCDFLSYLMLVCMGLCMVTQIVAFSYIVILISIFATFKYNESLVPILFFLFLLPTMFDAGLSIGIDKIVLAIAFIGKFNKSSSFRGTKYGKKYYPIFLWFICACVFSGFMSSYSDPWSGAGLLVSDVLIFFLYANSAIEPLRRSEIIERIARCALLMMAFLFVKSILNPVSVNDRLTLDDDLNINQFAMGISQTSSILFCYMLINNIKNKERMLYIATFIVGVYMQLSTGSRASTLALLGSCAIVYFVNTKYKRVSSRSFLYLIIVLTLLSVVFNNIVENNSYIGERFTVDNLVESDGSSRGLSLLIEYEHTIPEHPLFGVGPSSDSEMDAVAKYGGYFSSHNIIFSTLTQIGFFGFTPFVIICILVIRRLFRLIKTNPIYSIPLGLVLACIINGVGEVVYNSRMIWFAISFSLYLINSSSAEPMYLKKDN